MTHSVQIRGEASSLESRVPTRRGADRASASRRGGSTVGLRMLPSTRRVRETTSPARPGRARSQGERRPTSQVVTGRRRAPRARGSGVPGLDRQVRWIGVDRSSCGKSECVLWVQEESGGERRERERDETSFSLALERCERIDSGCFFPSLVFPSVSPSLLNESALVNHVIEAKARELPCDARRTFPSSPRVH